MAYVTSDQIAAVRSLDLLTYLQRYIPDELIKVGNTYTTRSHDSLKISNGKWYWWSQKMGGVSALDYLIKVRGVSLPDAVKHLSDCMGIPLPAQARQSSDTAPRDTKYPSLAHRPIERRRSRQTSSRKIWKN